MAEWYLFVDESGKLDETGDAGVVAGVLLRSEMDATALDAALRIEIANAQLQVDYPPHIGAIQSDTARRRVCRKLRSIVGNLPPAVANAAFLLAAYSPPHVSVTELAAGPYVPDRYTQALGALLERCVALLRGPECTHDTVHLCVATRGLKRPNVQGWSHLTQNDLVHVAKQVVAHPPHPEERLGHRVGLRADATPRYTHTVPAGVVLADFCANRLRGRILACHDVNAATLRRQLQESIGLPVLMSSCAFAGSHMPLSTLAVDGDLRVGIQDAIDGRLTPPLTGGAAPWIVTEHNKWLRAISEHPRPAGAPCVQ